jgi:hypothetical protein
MRASESLPPRTRSRTAARPPGTSITSGSQRSASASIPAGTALELGGATPILLTYHGDPLVALPLFAALRTKGSLNTENLCRTLTNVLSGEEDAPR